MHLDKVGALDVAAEAQTRYATRPLPQMCAGRIVAVVMQRSIALALAASALSTSLVAQQRTPIIDMLLHAYGKVQWSGGPTNPATSDPGPSSAEEHMRQTFATMDQYNIVAAVVSGSLEAVEVWRTYAPNRVIASPLFGRPNYDNFGAPLPTIDSLRALYVGQRLGAMAEITAQYEGLSPSDTTLDPYFALAEELDIPVGIHTGRVSLALHWARSLSPLDGWLREYIGGSDEGTDS